MGRKIQLVINFDSLKFFTFTVRNDHSVNVNLNFSCCTGKKLRLFRGFFQKISNRFLDLIKLELLNLKLLNLKFKFLLVGWRVVSSA